MVTLMINGGARPKARARVKGKGVYTPKATREWEDLVRLQAKIQYGSSLLMTGRLIVRIHFYGLDRRGDLDNYAKSILDALQGLIYRNDNQIDDLRVVRCGGKTKYVTIIIREI